LSELNGDLLITRDLKHLKGDHNLQMAKSLSVILRKTRTIVVITLSTILLFECTYRVILRLAPNLLRHAAPLGLDYGDTWRSSGLAPGGSLKENFDAMVLGPYGNTVHWKTNAQGFRNDYDVTPEPGPGVVRVISIGDSFTAGYRLAQNETFSFLLEHYLNSKSDGSKYEVLISVVDNPTDGLDYLSRLGLSFNPKLVLLGLTLGNDNAGTYVRLAPGGKYTLDDESGKIEPNASPTLGFSHGLEKMLLPAACVYPSRTPFLDQHSITYHILKQLWRSTRNGEAIASWYEYDKENVKLFDPMQGLGAYLNEAPREVQQSYDQLFRTLRGLKKIMKNKGVDFAVVILPQRFQVQEEDWTCTVADYRLNEGCFDLSLPNRLITDFCIQNDIVCIDPTQAMIAAHRISRRSLYCPQGDMHLNAEGNRAIFEAIKDEVYRRVRKESVSH